MAITNIFTNILHRESKKYAHLLTLVFHKVV